MLELIKHRQNASEPALFLHGGPGMDSSYFFPFLESLFPEIDWVTYNQKRNASVEDLKSELLEVLHRFEVPVSIVGHSWGGMLAVETLKELSKSQKIKNLVLLCTALDSSVNEFFHRAIEKRLEDSRFEYEDSKDRDLAYKDQCLAYLPVFFHAGYLPAASKVIESIQYSGETFDQAEGYLSSFHLIEGIRRLEIPITVLYSENDLRFPKDYFVSLEALSKKF